jgi:hypothetical protein
MEFPQWKFAQWRNALTLSGSCKDPPLSEQFKLTKIYGKTLPVPPSGHANGAACEAAPPLE